VGCRRFAFRLRTLFAAVAVLVVVAAIQTEPRLDWARQRQDIREKLSPRGVKFVPFSSARKTPLAPNGLWVFGEPGFGEVIFHQWRFDAPEVNEVVKLFSEARVSIVTSHFD
jgi:hypothetical protein